MWRDGRTRCPAHPFSGFPVLTPALAPRAIDADRPPRDPLAQLLRVIDRAIAGCETFDPERATGAIRLLRCTLDLSSSESRTFDALYGWCETAVLTNDFIGAARCLRSLRAAWVQAMSPPYGVPYRAGLPVS